MSTVNHQPSETIGVFFGGVSPEHDISIITGQLIISQLKKSNYRVVPVYIAKNGAWFCAEELGELKFFTTGNLTEKLSRLEPIFLGRSQEEGKIVFLFARSGLFRRKQIVIDLAFPAFHGLNGEDGTIQGVFELFNVPYVGSGVCASALTMDKVFTKIIYQKYKIPTPDFIYFYKYEWEEKKEKILAAIKSKLNFPVFVKPARLGSSIGISKVEDRIELENACEIALHYDEKVLVEEGVKNLKDLTCAVLGNDKLEASLVQESLFGRDFFSYEDKYLKDGGAQLGKGEGNIIIPANISQEVTEYIQKTAKRIFKIFNCAGMVRVDFLHDTKTGITYANEVNTIPGTLYHHLWEKSGWPLSKLIERLLELAKERYAAGKQISRVFPSNILEKVGSSKLKLSK